MKNVEEKKKSSSKKELVQALISEGKTRKEIAKMKIVSSTYLSKFYAN